MSFDVPLLILFAVLGLVVGSFLNVCIYRLPHGSSVAWPPSHCTSCARQLAWFENVPVVSWIVLRGRCRGCGAQISMIYPIVEILTAVLVVGAYLVYGLTPLLAVRLLFVCALVVLFAIDFEHQILPNVITLPGIVIGFALSFLVPPGWASSLGGMLAGGLFPFLVAEAYLRIRGREGMGMGDFKMLGMVGAFLGWPLVWVTLILSCLLGIVVGGGALLISRRGFGTRIPFGTFIAVAALVGVYWSDQVLSTYAGLISAYLEWAGLTG
jgi:leader peptidase (prepilin peptidase) / N-methyltransferase